MEKLFSIRAFAHGKDCWSEVSGAGDMTLPKGGPPTYLGKGYKIPYKRVLIEPLGFTCCMHVRKELD